MHKHKICRRVAPSLHALSKPPPQLDKQRIAIAEVGLGVKENKHLLGTIKLLWVARCAQAGTIFELSPHRLDHVFGIVAPEGRNNSTDVAVGGLRSPAFCENH